MKRKKCVAYKSCKRKAKYTAPNDWCSKHWNKWWDYALKDKEELPYMKIKKRRVISLSQKFHLAI